MKILQIDLDPQKNSSHSIKKTKNKKPQKLEKATRLSLDHTVVCIANKTICKAH